MTMAYRYPDECTYIPVASVEDVPPGERLFLEIEGEPIVIFNIGGQFFAIRDECTHDGGPIGEGTIEGHEIICPRHGARFDLRTGKALTLPAVVDVPAYRVRVREGQIEICFPTSSSSVSREEGHDVSHPDH